MEADRPRVLDLTTFLKSFFWAILLKELEERVKTVQDTFWTIQDGSRSMILSAKGEHLGGGSGISRA